MGFHAPPSPFLAGFVAPPAIAKAGGAHVVSRGNAALSFSGAVAGKKAGGMTMAAPETYTVVVVRQVARTLIVSVMYMVGVVCGYCFGWRWS